MFLYRAFPTPVAKFDFAVPQAASDESLAAGIKSNDSDNFAYSQCSVSGSGKEMAREGLNEVWPCVAILAMLFDKRLAEVFCTIKQRIPKFRTPVFKLQLQEF